MRPQQELVASIEERNRMRRQSGLSPLPVDDELCRLQRAYARARAEGLADPDLSSSVFAAADVQRGSSHDLTLWKSVRIRLVSRWRSWTWKPDESRPQDRVAPSRE